MSKLRFLFSLTVIPVLVLSLAGNALAKGPSEIIHDAEYYVLEAQHGTKWAAEDKELDKKLTKLRKKHGIPPNIIHIMWDDTGVGEVGIPQIQKMRGWETPNMNKFGQDGIFFTRMYTEPSCTPSRAAVMTGRHAVRNGMYNVGFPYEYGGIAADEVTMAEVLGKAGYATAFYGKSHLGDVESSYLNKQGFDEALWTPYNQVPSLYIPQLEKAGVIVPTTLRPELFPKDPYDIDKGFHEKKHQGEEAVLHCLLATDHPVCRFPGRQHHGQRRTAAGRAGPAGYLYRQADGRA